MDYKYIEQLMERYWNAETSLEEESILRAFFSQENIPAEMVQWKSLFRAEVEEPHLGDDFDARILAMIQDEQPAVEATKVVKAQQVQLNQRLMPLFKAAAVVAIILTLGGALQAPWDKSWDTPVVYAAFQADTVDVATPVQAENIVDKTIDSTSVMLPARSKN
ncbi:MAG: pyruvate ferredoxin oxidoreductase [Prevotella sp.]|nr:pyruvate ferredoxin oxidoreductase [Prevotella sp.]